MRLNSTVQNWVLSVLGEFFMTWVEDLSVLTCDYNSHLIVMK